MTEAARVLVTGPAGGLGREVALMLAARGCAVGLADLDAVGLQGTAPLVRERGGEVLVVPGDLTAEGSRRRSQARGRATGGPTRSC